MVYFTGWCMFLWMCLQLQDVKCAVNIQAPLTFPSALASGQDLHLTNTFILDPMIFPVVLSTGYFQLNSSKVLKKSIHKLYRGHQSGFPSQRCILMERQSQTRASRLCSRTAKCLNLWNANGQMTKDAALQHDLPQHVIYSIHHLFTQRHVLNSAVR